MDLISKLMFDYSHKNDLNIRKFIANVAEIVVAYRKLSDYVYRIIYETFSRDSNAKYGNKRIVVFDNYLKTLNDKAKKFDLSDSEYKYYIYSKLLSTLVHEIEHAEQLRLREIENEDIKTLLIKTCNMPKDKVFSDIDAVISRNHFLDIIGDIEFKLKMFLSDIKLNKIDKIYDKYWLLSPTERMANLVGNSFSLEVLENLSKTINLDNLKEIMMGVINSHCLDVYEISARPSQYYFDKFNISCSWLIEADKSLSLEERLYYGLELSEDELDMFKNDRSKVLSVVNKLSRF